MKVVVTGATGFTGQRVVDELLKRGHEVIALVRPPSQGRSLPGGIGVVEGDLGDAAALARLLEHAEGFVHAASLGFGHAAAVASAVEASRAGRAVFFSSTSIFTRLDAPSKAIRLAAEERIRALSAAWTIVRPTMIYGAPGDRNMERLIGFVAKSPVVPLPGGGRALVQPVHVADLGRAVVDALASERAARREYNLPGADPAPLRDVVLHVARLLGRRPLILPVPIQLTARLVALWRRLGLPPRVSAEQVLRLAEDKAFAYDAARRDWGYAPIGFRDGLAKEVAELRASGRLRR